LASSGDKPVSRETLTDLLWGSHFDDQARQNFRQALSRLRKLLGADAIISDDQSVRLNHRHVSADIARFEALRTTTDAKQLANAHQLARAEFLDGAALRDPAFTDWLALARKRLAGELRDIHHRLATTALAANDAAVALTHADAILRHDALDEDAHRLKLQALA